MIRYGALQFRLRTKFSKCSCEHPNEDYITLQSSSLQVKVVCTTEFGKNHETNEWPLIAQVVQLYPPDRAHYKGNKLTEKAGELL